MPPPAIGPMGFIQYEKQTQNIEKKTQPSLRAPYVGKVSVPPAATPLPRPCFLLRTAQTFGRATGLLLPLRFIHECERKTINISI